ncbi:hypothetical protein BJ970_000062 [Saccharopolyspora phatthalungensis]|uniref:Uncharacterized protein n=1 Tax=Saccharopolyspora phatthalungensis TaxID=664693 RepID=A0A840Q157_9PSEU|nr:hypothetical protein [Saccharopolyspora phatthalungensis]
MRPAVSEWLSVSGDLYGGPWYPGVFQALKHRLGPDSYEVNLDGRVSLFSLCGSPVVKTEPLPHIKMCSKCKRHLEAGKGET